MKFILYLIFIITGGAFIFSLFQFTLYNGFGAWFEYSIPEDFHINKTIDSTTNTIFFEYSYKVSGQKFIEKESIFIPSLVKSNVNKNTVFYNKIYPKYSYIGNNKIKVRQEMTGMQISAFFFIVFFLIYRFGDLKKWEGIYFRGEYVVHKQPTKTSQIIRRIINVLIVSTTAMLLIRIIVALVMIYLFNGFNNKFDYVKVDSNSIVEFDSIYLKKHINYEYFIDKKGYKKSESVPYNKISKYDFFEDKIFVNKKYPALSYIGNNKLVLQQNIDKIIFSVLGLFLLILLFGHVNINKIMELKEARKKRRVNS